MRLYFVGDKPTLVGHSDSNRDGEIESINPTLDYMIKLAKVVVAWQSRLQKCVALSIT